MGLLDEFSYASHPPTPNPRVTSSAQPSVTRLLTPLQRPNCPPDQQSFMLGQRLPLSHQDLGKQRCRTEDSRSPASCPWSSGQDTCPQSGALCPLPWDPRLQGGRARRPAVTPGAGATSDWASGSDETRHMAPEGADPCHSSGWFDIHSTNLYRVPAITHPRGINW